MVKTINVNSVCELNATTTISVIGLGVSARANLCPDANHALNYADVVLGSTRQLATIQHLLKQQTIALLPKLVHLENYLSNHQGRSIAVLATGDPLFYGIGSWFVNHYSDKPGVLVQCYSAISSIQVVCHLLGLSLQNVEVISLHGRKLNGFRSQIRHDRTYVILTDQHSSPAMLAAECVHAGFAQSTLWVAQMLGYPEQKVEQFSVAALINGHHQFANLHITVIKTKGDGGIFAEFPGIDDKQFITDSDEKGKGLLTKKEIRINILSLLETRASDVGWDIGAGCGGVAVEWALWHRYSNIYAIEQHPQRLHCLFQNQQQFGVEKNLTIVNGNAPQVLLQLPDPNVIFIGGSDGHLSEILSYCWQRLNVGGRLVASAVTERSKHILYQFSQSSNTIKSHTVQLSVNRGEQLAGQLLYRPAIAVTLWQMIKQPSTANND